MILRLIAAWLLHLHAPRSLVELGASIKEDIIVIVVAVIIVMITPVPRWGAEV